MSDRREHRAQIPSGEVTDALASVMGEESPLIAWNRRVGRIKVNGVPLAEQHARFKRPDDVIFHKQTHEALMGADIIAGLGLDDEVVDITSQDNPDLILHFRDGSDVYADFTRACVDLDEENNEAIRDVNRRLRIELVANPPGDLAGEPVSPHITLRVRPTGRLDRDRLFEEVLGWIRTSNNQTATPGPLLTGLGAQFSWFDSKFQGHETVVVSMAESRDLPSLIAAVQKRISDKVGRYPQRPLWLLISISESWANRTIGGSYVEFIKAARDGSLTFDLGDFDRVAVGVTGSAVFLKHRRDGDG
jgi:hypothetical protein